MYLVYVITIKYNLTIVCNTVNRHYKNKQHNSSVMHLVNHLITTIKRNNITCQ